MKEQFGTRLRRLRIEKGLSASQLAKTIGVARSTYSDWENGMGIKQIPYQLISQVLAISVSELVTGETPSFVNVLKELESIENKVHVLRTQLSSVI